MKRLIHFFSIAVMTQVTLMLSQLILLPLQIRIWGQAETAFWNAALALATITSVVDCGLRTAGHSDLIKANSDPAAFPAERLAFEQIWSWIRVLILLVTALLIGADFIRERIWTPNADSSWHWMLIVSYALEAVLVIRITYLDSLGFYRGAEASYLGFAVLRLCASIPAILLLHFRPSGLAVIFLSTSVVALLGQSFWLRRKAPLLHLNSRFVALSWRSLALARFTVAEPIANWTRLSFPVLIISQIASPVAVNTYVGLRAVFGAGRTTIQQLARVASVEVLKVRIQGYLRRADSLLTLFVTSAICLGSFLSFFIIIDNLRILGLYMEHFNRAVFQQVVLAFSLTAPFFSYQICMNLMFRMGELASVARRHYGFIGCALTFALACLFVRSLAVYLALLVVAELILSFSFLGSRAAVSLAALTSLAIAAVWLFVHNDVGGWFTGVSMRKITMSSSLFLISTASLAWLLYLSRRSDLRSLKKPETVAQPAVLTQ